MLLYNELLNDITECKYNSALYNELLNDITECKYNSALYNELLNDITECKYNSALYNEPLNDITECKYNSALYNEPLNDITECKYNSALYNELLNERKRVIISRWRLSSHQLKMRARVCVCARVCACACVHVRAHVCLYGGGGSCVSLRACLWVFKGYLSFSILITYISGQFHLNLPIYCDVCIVYGMLTINKYIIIDHGLLVYNNRPWVTSI